MPAEEKARTLEARRIRYAVDDDFRETISRYCRSYYVRNRAAILARTANRRRTDPTVQERAAAAYRQKTAAARASKMEKYARWLADPMPTFRSLAPLPMSSRRRIIQRDRARRRAASKALAKKQ